MFTPASAYSHSKKVKEACHRCDSTSHLQKDCTEKRTKSDSTSAANLIEPISVTDPYCVSLKFLMFNGNREYTIDAEIDPGSPGEFHKKRICSNGPV